MGHAIWKVTAVATLLATTAALAQRAPTPPPPQADLPVTRVVLFTTGVGYFEHSGTVTGTQELDLPVATAQMDDLLQSLVVEDLDGGTIRPVRYPSQDPLPRILSGYALDLSGDPTLAELLAQARGERVHVEAARPLDGTVVNVEQVPAADGPPTTYLTLLSATGLQRLDLAEVTDLRFQDPAVQADLESALAAVARYRGRAGTAVRLRFEGEGTRRVRVGYVREMPVWKTSYRLVLRGDGRADLQGWAIVDNPTDLDLTDVSLAFVAGRPISFVAGLYDPIYLQRPHVAVAAAPSVVPQAYAGSSAAALKSANRAAPAQADGAMEAAPAPGAAPSLSGAGVAAMAQGSGTDATFVYRVSQPVSVGRHESAMIPIVLSTVAAPRVSVYDPSVLATHPLRGVRLKNDTGLHLAAGPVSVFDDSGFTGDARMNDVVPGDARLLTYAVDLGVDVSSQGSTEPERVTAVTLANGAVLTTSKQRLRTTYTLTARDDHARTVVLQQPKRPGYALVSPTPAPAETPDAYRFGVALAARDGTAPGDAGVPLQAHCRAGERCTLQVVLERTVRRSVAVSNVSTGDIARYLGNVELSAADRATLQKVLELKRAIADLDRQIAQAQSRIDAIFQDQARIRQNMAALERSSSLYRRYAADLQNQENELQDLRTQLSQLRSKRADQQSRLDTVLGGLGAGS